MKGAGYLLGACIFLAAVKVVAMAIALGIILAVIVGAITKPRETLGLLAFLVLINVIDRSPTAFIVAVAIIGGLSIILDRAR